jgi:ankyrin repeat protein
LDASEVISAVRLTLGRSDINAVNEAGQSALHGAARMALDDVVQLLVERGAVLDLADKKGDTPTELARRAAAQSTVELMNRLRGGTNGSSAPTAPLRPEH